MKKHYILFTFIMHLLNWTIAPTATQAEILKKDSLQKEKRFSVIGVVLPGSNPENKFYLNGGLITVFKTDRKDSTLRLSNLYVYGLYSQLHQYRTSIGGDIFTRKEKYYFNGWIYYSYLPELYFGTTNAVTPKQNEFISYRLWYVNISALRKIHSKWFGGVVYNFENAFNFNFKSNGIAETKPVAGMSAYTVSGPGIRVRYDSRDNLLSSRTGILVDLQYAAFKGGFGSQYNFDSYSIDFRKFINLSPKKYSILAFNALASYTDGNVPFRYLPSIKARGYHPNFYRDNFLTSFQAEYRFMIWRWIGASLFGGVSEVSKKPSSLTINNLRENYGGGIRIRILKKNNMFMRIEYGQSSNTSNFYISFNDAF